MGVSMQVPDPKVAQFRRTNINMTNWTRSLLRLTRWRLYSLHR